MLRFLSSLLLASASACLFAQAPTAPAPILPAQMQWQGNPTIPGAETLWVIGSATASGIYAQRVKLPAGGMIPPHVHTDERFSVVLAGTIYVGFGETFVESDVVAVPAGALYIAPAGVPHYVWAKDGPAEYQESGVGPTGTTFTTPP